MATEKGLLHVSRQRTILLIAKVQPVPSAGTSYGQFALIPRLAHQGIAAYVVTLHPVGRPVSKLPILRNVTRLEFHQYEKDAPNLIWIHPPSIRTPSSFINEILFSVIATLTIMTLRLLRRIRFDAIYSAYPFFLCLAGGFISKVTRVRWVAIPSFATPEGFFMGWKGKILRLVERVTFFLRPQAILQNEPLMAKQLAERYGRKDVIFFPTCYANIFKERPSTEQVLNFRKEHDLDSKTVILFAGTMHPEYNRVDILAKVVAEVIKQRPNVRFLIAAINQDGLRKLKMFISELKIDDYFVFLGRVPHRVMPLIIQSCDISLNINYTSSFGFKVIEGMISGKPTISAAPWYDQYDRFLVNGQNTILVPLSVEALRDAILKIIDDGEFRRRIAENGYTTIRPYDQDYEDKFFKKLFFPDIDAG